MAPAEALGFRPRRQAGGSGQSRPRVVVGERALAIGGGAVGRWRELRIATTTSGSVISAMTRRRPPQVQAKAPVLESGSLAASLRQAGASPFFASRRVPVRERHDVTSPRRMRSEDAVEANERMTRGWDEGAESREKLRRAHHAVGLRTARVLDAIRDAPVREYADALEPERGSGAVPE